jgi:hypothetical protein
VTSFVDCSALGPSDIGYRDLLYRCDIMSAPEISDLPDAILSSISDSAVRKMFSRMIASQSSIVQSNCAFQLQIMSHLESLSSWLDASLRVEQQPAVVYPQVVMADQGAVTSGSSGSCLTRSGCTSGSSEGPLRCPFCPAQHTNEKSHVQHINRLAKRCNRTHYDCLLLTQIKFRMRRHYRKGCKIRPSHPMVKQCLSSHAWCRPILTLRKCPFI